MSTLTVQLGERSYPIHIGRGLLHQAGESLKERGIAQKSPLLIVSDENVAGFYLAALESNLQESGYKTVSFVVKPGETSKSLAVFEQVITAAIEGGLDRNSAVIALGGGVVGDLAGFVAASFMRGIKFVQVPTTILAHDSSVGGKVGINHPLAKNMIGAFHQPELVLYDVDTLSTLPPREVSAGLAEMIKHGLIWDADFAQWCREHATDLLALDAATLEYGLEKGCSIKAEVVSRDERENDLRAILNLGHTIGHAIEAIAGYGEFLHGEAISIGMVGSALLGVKLGADPSLVNETKEMLSSLRLPTSLPSHLDTDRLLEAMMHDKKFKEGSITFVVPRSIGRVEVVKDISVSYIREVIEQLKEEA
ncbi:3-dehydroquinate synthase [Paenibacillus jamilae]|uniref:3-dehydroquinate synthase n=2 Tax=Paenibacillus TaxID=44249 RepID=E3E4U6_PAEPS|nr:MULTISPECIES: 3-dehydroquinate synthase [Paenibacillus]ADO57074.1 3-dehydroquinate synthase [Paenibacillus polymyxa SC2]AUO08397.1 3-dehydroquinate synthase [Paenibacillus sp. lzh-N1]AZH29969.1 3-dehydroquinate synthase [Paenibacillus sp. M-152]KTS82033.1 3-dehydroquinate synthase [Paenibacillus jamilae]WPQ54881.1 3-dehydroquinate synthase [Paenibacillus polymyxa]